MVEVKILGMNFFSKTRKCPFNRDFFLLQMSTCVYEGHQSTLLLS